MAEEEQDVFVEKLKLAHKDVDPGETEITKLAVKMWNVNLEVDGCVVRTRIPVGKTFYADFDAETGNLKGINWY